MYYEIQGTTTRILGSMHLFPRGMTAVPPRVEAACKWADKLCIEHTGQKLQPFTLLPEGQDLQSVISARTWEILGRLIAEGTSIDGIRPLKLWAAFLMLSRNALDAVDGTEMLLMQRAHAAGRAISTLELDEELAQFLDLIPIEALALLFDYYCDDPARAQTDFQRSYKAWYEGSAAALWEIQKEGPIVKQPEVYRRLLSDRNHLWADRIEQVAPRDHVKSLILVGATHLVGPDNLIDLLRAKTFVVVEVPDSAV
jgi:uncharacterized protein YbaP (TraB family)